MTHSIMTRQLSSSSSSTFMPSSTGTMFTQRFHITTRLLYLHVSNIMGLCCLLYIRYLDSHFSTCLKCCTFPFSAFAVPAGPISLVPVEQAPVVRRLFSLKQSPHRTCPNYICCQYTYVGCLLCPTSFKSNVQTTGNLTFAGICTVLDAMFKFSCGLRMTL
jgi:hypothetical protein